MSSLVATLSDISYHLSSPSQQCPTVSLYISKEGPHFPSPHILLLSSQFLEFIIPTSSLIFHFLFFVSQSTATFIFHPPLPRSSGTFLRMDAPLHPITSLICFPSLKPTPWRDLLFLFSGFSYSGCFVGSFLTNFSLY